MADIIDLVEHIQRRKLEKALTESYLRVADALIREQREKMQREYEETLDRR